jgi:hypothetical protein
MFSYLNILNMNQTTLAIFTLTATVAFGATMSLVPPGFTEVLNGGIFEDDDTFNISGTSGKVKSGANCNISGWGNDCENESESEISTEEE